MEFHFSCTVCMVQYVVSSHLNIKIICMFLSMGSCFKCTYIDIVYIRVINWLSSLYNSNVNVIVFIIIRNLCFCVE